jgi:hypothetical protein
MANSTPTPAHEEIKDAFYSVLSREEDRRQVWWISVGLVNNNLGLDWHSFVNHESIHAAQFCREKTASPICTPKSNQILPPCVLDHIEIPCSFRKALSDLEEATMHTKSHSQGRISILYWEIKKEAPYISKDPMHFPWLVDKEKLLQVLLRQSKPLLDPDDPSGYERHAKLCMSSEQGECSAALIPLLQHRSLGDNAYVGAIAVCGTKQSDIWRHLPHVRAVATSLLETRRHLKAVISKKDKDLAILLMDQLLQDLDEEQNLFSGECRDPDCEHHSSRDTKAERRLRHDYECRIARRADYFIGALGKPVFENKLTGDSWKLQKSLFCIGKLQAVNGIVILQEPIKDLPPAKSHAVTLRAIAVFFRDAFGINLDIGDQVDERIVWPRRPGLFTLIGIYDVYRDLNPGARFDGTTGKNNPAIRVRIKEKNRKDTTVSFSIDLTDAVGAKVLKKRIKDEPQGSMTSNINRLRACMPTRAVIPPSREDAEIVRILNTPAYNAVLVRVDTRTKPPVLCLEWDFARMDGY